MLLNNVQWAVAMQITFEHKMVSHTEHVGLIDKLLVKVTPKN